VAATRPNIALTLNTSVVVGGKNVIRMKDLATCFEEHGYRNVATYIQSGNVLFNAASSSSSAVKRVERVEVPAALRKPACLSYPRCATAVTAAACA